MDNIRLLVGWDEREAVGSHVFLQSVVEQCSLPVEVTVLTPKLLKQLSVGTDGSNAFSKARFLSPYIYGYSGYSIFMDGADMLCMVDLAELWSLKDYYSAVQVVQHDYTPQSAKKYIGTELEAKNEAYPRKNWSSLIMWNNSYFGHRKLTPEYVDSTPGPELHRFSWVEQERIGWLPKEWNVLIGEDNQSNKPKIAHYTNGIPGFTHYESAQFSNEWKRAWYDMNKGLQVKVSLGASER